MYLGIMLPITFCPSLPLGIFSFLHFSWIDLLDIIMVALVIYCIIRWIRGSSALNIFIAVVIVLLIRIFAAAIGMKMISSLLGTIIDVGAIALIVIFQPEIRRFLNNLGRGAGNTLEKRSIFRKLLLRENADRLEAKASDEIAAACMEMSEQKTGALIVLRHNDSLEDITATGDSIDADISKRLIMNLFFKNSPLHDGAVIIGGNRIIAARCTLPITDRTDLPARYGMRHKAAVGLSEACDADIVVVSEQTGNISFVRGGIVTKIDSINTLKLKLGGQGE